MTSKPCSRELIMQTAMALFAESGYKETTTLQIAQTACVSEALIFKHFRSKQALVEHLVVSGYQRIIKWMRGRLVSSEPLTLLHQVVELPIQMVKEEPLFWQMQSRLRELAIARQQYVSFLRPLPSLLHQAFSDLGYAQPAEESRLLLLLLDALWKQQVELLHEPQAPLLELIKSKYNYQVHLSPTM